MPNKVSDDSATQPSQVDPFFEEEKFVRYMIEYTIRSAGLTHTENFAGAEALLAAFGKWKPEDGLTVHAFLSNLAGNGGYVLAEVKRSQSDRLVRLKVQLLERGQSCSSDRSRRRGAGDCGVPRLGSERVKKKHVAGVAS